MKAWERDYNFYLLNKDKFQFFGDALNLDIPYDSEGKTAEMAFKEFDSQGKLVACKDTSLLKAIITCKKSINFHIKLWAEGFKDFGESIEYYIEELINPPKWVEDSLKKQIGKLWPDQKNRAL